MKYEGPTSYQSKDMANVNFFADEQMDGTIHPRSIDTGAQKNIILVPKALLSFVYINRFGRSNHDYLSILTPLRQCCQIKQSTLLKLVKLYNGPEKLSGLLSASLQHDPVTPVLLPKHLGALDRRVVEILKAVAKCLVKENDLFNAVIYNDFSQPFTP